MWLGGPWQASFCTQRRHDAGSPRDSSVQFGDTTGLTKTFTHPSASVQISQQPKQSHPVLACGAQVPTHCWESPQEFGSKCAASSSAGHGPLMPQHACIEQPSSPLPLFVSNQQSSAAGAFASSPGTPEWKLDSSLSSADLQYQSVRSIKPLELLSTPSLHGCAAAEPLQTTSSKNAAQNPQIRRNALSPENKRRGSRLTRNRDGGALWTARIGPRAAGSPTPNKQRGQPIMGAECLLLHKKKAL